MGDTSFSFKLTFGQFESPDKRGLDATGASSYNVLAFNEKHTWKIHAVLDESGEKFTFEDGNINKWVTDQYVEEVKSSYDEADSPQHSYKLQPENQGRLIWISGASGMGKTTTAKMLQEKKGFVNYEGDCFLFGLNPFVGSAPKGPSHWGTKPLKNIPEERKVASKKMMSEGYMKKLKGEDVPEEVWENFYKLMCANILALKEKIGGKWVVNQAVYTRQGRDTIVKELGQEAVMFVLEAEDPEIQVERLCKRSLEEGSGEVTEEAREAKRKEVKQWTGNYDHVSEDEERVIRIEVTKDMNPEDVVEVIMDQIN